MLFFYILIKLNINYCSTIYQKYFKILRENCYHHCQITNIITLIERGKINNLRKE